MSDIEIAKSINLKHINKIAETLSIPIEELEHFGKYKAKLPLKLIDDKKVAKSKLILVTAVSPTPAGEGKTTLSIGLAQGLNKIGKKTTVVLREPSLGPVFGMKGGAAGGGYQPGTANGRYKHALYGRFSAIEKANNLLSALIDNNIQSKSRTLDIDPRTSCLETCNGYERPFLTPYYHWSWRDGARYSKRNRIQYYRSF